MDHAPWSHRPDALTFPHFLFSFLKTEIFSALRMAKIVIIDDEPAMVEVIVTLCREKGHQVFPFNAAPKAVEQMDSIQPHVVIADIRMETMTGFDVLRHVREHLRQTAVILITAYASVETAVEAMKMGAYDYVTKPFKIDELQMTVQRALDYQAALRENVYLRKELKNKYKFENIIGTSRKMQLVYSLINKVADTDSTVLIQGESGTGKELVARLAFQQQPPASPICRDQLQCASGKFAGVGIVRSQKRRVYRSSR